MFVPSCYRRFTRLLFALLAPLLALTAAFPVSATPNCLQTAIVTSLLADFNSKN